MGTKGEIVVEIFLLRLDQSYINESQREVLLLFFAGQLCPAGSSYGPIKKNSRTLSLNIKLLSAKQGFIVLT